MRKKGKEIAAFMKKHHITQEEMAQRLGCQPRSIRWWITGTYEPLPIFWNKFLQVREQVK